MKLVFATNNAHKLEEIKRNVRYPARDCFFKEIQCHEDIPEEQDTLEGNALQKARYIHAKYGLDCFADDTGLEIKALNNAPGVYSARYAGNAHDSEANMKKVLQEMQNIPERQARFRTVIALILGERNTCLKVLSTGRYSQASTGSRDSVTIRFSVPKVFKKVLPRCPFTQKTKSAIGGQAVRELCRF